MEWFVVEIGLGTGLRAAEMVGLHCGDIVLDGVVKVVIVRRGKGGKPRMVKVSSAFLETVREFFRWKERWGEPCGGDDPLLCGPGGRRLSKRTLQAMVTRAFAAADVQGHRTHDLRHSYACHLLRASGHNLRLVQKQLGHASIRTTEVYADIFDPDADRAVEGVSASMNEFQLSENS